MSPRNPPALLTLLALAGCGGGAAPSMAPMEMKEEARYDDAAGGDEGDGAYGGGPGGFARQAAPAAVAADAAPTKPQPEMAENAPMGRRGEAKEKDGAEGEDGGERLRQWFPESFLWQPIVETGDDGKASIQVRVPDQLTTWRILALAHSRDGQQAGAVHTFDSSLPLYVDPVVPGWLFAGDRVVLPVQVVNTTDSAKSASLTVSATGALSGSAAGSVSLGAGASDVKAVALEAKGAGASRVKAVLAGGDAAEREIPVLPQGRPVEVTRGGTLSSDRSFALSAPAGADPTTQEVSVLVFPGPLSVLQAEIERGGTGATPWNAAYGFALAARMSDLSAQMHVEADPKQVRRVQLVSWQRVVEHGRSPDAGAAADLLAALKDVHGHELAEGLASRMARTVADGQRSDGTWARQATGSKQLVVVQTAFAGRALPETSAGPRLKASGALERLGKDVDDPYTAAVVLASGLVDGDSADKLREIVLKGVTEAEDGRRSVSVPANVQNPWGWSPSQAEMLAWTTLALADQADLPWRGDLVAELMAGYDAGWGFGAGPADVLALEAICESLPGLDKPVTVVMTLDGAEVARSTLDPAQPKVPAVLSAKGSGTVGLKVEPQVPGLAFVATQRSWVPWSGAESLPGIDVEVTPGGKWRVGQDQTLTIELAAPSGTAVVVEQGLPAGAIVDEDALGRLSDRLTEWQVSTDRVRFVTRPFSAGEVISVPIVARPAFAGRFSTVPLSVAARGSTPVEIAPLVWEVAP